MNTNDIIDAVDTIFDDTVKIRRRIHKNPELSYQEYETQKLILEELEKIGIEGKKIADTGVIAVIGQGEECIALRADIDALPIHEETALTYASENDGKMHACGHDLHTSMLLGVSRVLKENESKLKKQIKLMFQPGEEKLPGGATLMIKDGALENPAPTAVYGQHIYPGAKTGTVLTCPGPIMASADELYWTIKGNSTHAAQPHLGHDPIVCASALILAYQTMLTKYKDPLDSGVISVTSINGGNTTNVIPESVKMMGTMRAFNEDWRASMHTKLKSITEHIGEIYGCEIDFEIRKGYPFVNNDEKLAADITKTAKELFGNDRYEEFVPKMWGEDFAYYSQAGSSVFWMIGVNSSDEVMPPLHNPRLAPDEEGMKTGMAMMLGVCFDL